MDDSIAERAAAWVAAEAAVARLTDDEVLAFSLAVLLGYDGRRLPYAEKVRGLYTQEGGRGMHDVTNRAVQAALVERNPRLAGADGAGGAERGGAGGLPVDRDPHQGRRVAATAPLSGGLVMTMDATTIVAVLAGMVAVLWLVGRMD